MEEKDLQHEKEGIRQSIFWSLVTLSIPTILEQMLSTLLQYVDTAMVGRLGENATASVSVTTTVTWLINSVPAALSVAALSLIAQAVGSGDKEKIKRVASQVLMLAAICGLLHFRSCCLPKRGNRSAKKRRLSSS